MPAVKFQLSDPLFTVSCICYAGNRWLLKPRAHSDFLRFWFNDLPLVPCAIPLLYWVFRRVRVGGESPPQALELAWILAVWSVLCEVLGPQLLPSTTGDWRGDVLDGRAFRLGVLEAPVSGTHPPMSFDSLALHYHWMERVLAGNKLQECRVTFLEQVRSCEKVLLVGEGHGRFLDRAAEVNPRARFVCVDSSAHMIQVARQTLQERRIDAPVTFINSPILEAELPSDQDLLVTNFFLDCFEGAELTAVVARLRQSLRNGGRWIVSDFQVPRAGWKRARARIILFLAYRFFRVAVRLPARRLDSPRALLLRNGLKLTDRREYDCGLLYSELWTVTEG